jgi:tRNA/tmRNA/rRNA uracil-C5-methylase (TrmA/RlmC/RlmD family)
VTGEEVLIYGKTTISEILLDKKFDIQPKSFFQTNSLGAEKLYTIVVDAIKNK